jgi:uncharacterized membrane protein
MLIVNSKEKLRIDWVSLIADVLLLAMVIGPPIAPFMAESHFFLFPQIAEIIYFLGDHICPQPNMGLELAPPFTMIVCIRCYGTVTGLLITRLLYGANSGQEFYWLNQYGINGAALASLLMMAYPLELAAEVFGLWSFNNYLVTPFGLITGLAWGLFTMPILHKTKLTYEKLPPF